MGEKKGKSCYICIYLLPPDFPVGTTGVLLSPSGVFLSSKLWVRKMLVGEEESGDKMCCVIYPFFTILALLLQLFLQARSSAWFSTIFLLLWMFLQFLAAFAADPLCWYVSAGAD